MVPADASKDIGQSADCSAANMATLSVTAGLSSGAQGEEPTFSNAVGLDAFNGKE
jgi:hypothetical protein